MPSQAQDIFTPFELRQMTNDPETNPALSTFAEKIEPPLAEALKTVHLAGILSSQCVGSSPNRAILDPYVAEHIARATSTERSDANFLARRVFQGLTYVDVAQLCAGIDYLFGPKGVLLANAVTKGSGKMKLFGDRQSNPYIVVP
jgi:hypothetical protein